MILPGKETKEKRQHSTTYVPYSFYECDMPRCFLDVPMHWHSEFELNYVVHGRGEFTCGGGRFTAEAGGLLMIQPNILHAACPCGEDGLLYYALVFSPAMLGAGTHDRCTVESIRPLINGDCVIGPFIPADANNFFRLRACAEQIFSCVREDVPQADLLLKSELLRFFWLLETDGSILRQGESKVDYGENVRPALEYIMEHYSEPISVEQLAAVSHLSTSYFMSCFKKAVGLSSVEYLSHLRVNAACDLLLSSDRMISEIAFSCGYGNLSKPIRHPVMPQKSRGAGTYRCCDVPTPFPCPGPAVKPRTPSDPSPYCPAGSLHSP